MVQSKATTVKDYLKELPDERRAVIAAVRDVVRRNLPSGYKERMNYGMITYEIPLKRYPETYNGQPLCYMALAAQKNHFALYLMGYCHCAEQESTLKRDFQKAGKRLDMGKACVRFRKLEDLPLDVIGRVTASIPPEDFIQRYEVNRKK
jgi:hypothetical protein